MNDLVSLIREAAEAALDGELDDAARVNLYRLALTAAVSEFHRLAELSIPISPETLLIIQQIGLLCDDEVSAERLLGGMGLINKEFLDATVEDTGSSE